MAPTIPGAETVSAMVEGLKTSAAANKDNDWMDRWGPAVALVVLVALKVAVAMDYFAAPEALTGVTDLLTLGVGAWMGRLGAK